MLVCLMYFDSSVKTALWDRRAGTGWAFPQKFFLNSLFLTFSKVDKFQFLSLVIFLLTELLSNIICSEIASADDYV